TLVREVADGRQALTALKELEIDVLLLDLSLPRVNGLEVLRRAVARYPRTSVVVLSMHPAAQYEAAARKIGAAAHPSKSKAPPEVLRVIRIVAAGATIPDAAPPPIAGPVSKHKTLTAREYQVFTLLFQGRTVAEIAAELDLTSSTVSNHIAKIRVKLGVHS